MATYREGHQAFSRAAPSARRQMWSVMKFKWIGFLNHLFYERRYIASAPSLSNAAELSKSCGLVGSWMAGSGAAPRSQVRAGQEIAPVGRTQSERRRRLALAGGFRLLRSFGIDRLGAPDSGTSGGGGMLMASCLCRRASSRVGGGGIGSIRGPSGGGRFIGAVAAPLGPTDTSAPPS
jgi:hypothetical protein